MPPVPRPHWKEAELKTTQPLWRRILLGFFNVLTIFGGARAIGVTQLPQFIRPLYYRVRLKEAVAATTPQPIRAAESEVIAAPEAIASRTHTVVKGDSLWGIAKEAYGSGQRWIDIWRLNHAKIAEADLIYPGQEFMLPDVELHRESGARPGVSVKDVTPSMRVVKIQEAPQVSEESKTAKSKTEAGAGTQEAGGTIKNTQVLKNKIQPQIDALSVSLGQLAVSVNQYAQNQKAAKVSGEDTKHLKSYAAEAKKLSIRIAAASSQTQTIDAVVDLLDVARDATITVSQIAAAELPRGAQSLYPGGVYQTSTGAPMATNTGVQTAAPLAQAQATAQLQATAEAQTTAQAQTGTQATAASASAAAPVAVVSAGAVNAAGQTSGVTSLAAAPIVTAPAAVVAMQAAVLSQTAGSSTSTANATLPSELEVLITSAASILRDSIAIPLSTSEGSIAAGNAALNLTANAAAETNSAVASNDANRSIMGAASAVSGAVIANVVAPNSSSAAAATALAIEAAGALSSLDQRILADAAAANFGSGGGGDASSSGAGAVASSDSSLASVTSFGIPASGLGAGQGSIFGAAFNTALSFGTFGLFGQSNLSTTQTVVAAGIGIAALALPAPAPIGIVSAAFMGGFNQSQANASLLSMQQNIATQIAYQGYRAGEINPQTDMNALTNQLQAIVNNVIAAETMASDSGVNTNITTITTPAAAVAAMGGSFIGGIPGPGQIGNVSFGAGVLGGQVGALSSGQSFTISSPQGGTLASLNPNLTPAQLNEAFRVMRQNIPHNLNPPDEDTTNQTVDVTVGTVTVPDVNPVDVQDVTLGLQGVAAADAAAPSASPAVGAIGLGETSADIGEAAAAGVAAAAAAAASDAAAAGDAAGASCGCVGDGGGGGGGDGGGSCCSCCGSAE